MKYPVLQTENRVFRTYRGGKQLDSMLQKQAPKDSFQPEDWISSFVEAKNKNYIPGEGISKVLIDGKAVDITQVITPKDLGPGRTESGVLVKFLDAAERLGIQVHPTPAFSQKHFGTNYGKTECWHILNADPEKDAAVYIGFKEGITREKFAKMYFEQDVAGMLDALHRFSVAPGDTVLVTAGTPHAIGAGCFLLEIQEPSDYTMRVETTTVAGEKLTRMQISYGLSDDALLDCFDYTGLSRQAARQKYFLQGRPGAENEVQLVTYENTLCFALSRTTGKSLLRQDSFSTVVAMKPGKLVFAGQELAMQTGDKAFVPYGCQQVLVDCEDAIICYPPKV